MIPPDGAGDLSEGLPPLPIVWRRSSPADPLDDLLFFSP